MIEVLTALTKVLFKEFGITVVRVTAYSPYVVAEHEIVLILNLNCKIHRAYYRVREVNFALNGLLGVDLHNRTIGIIGTVTIGRIKEEFCMVLTVVF